MAKNSEKRSRPPFLIRMAPLTEKREYLIDSNILIYSFREHIYLRELINDDLALFSEVSRVEVLGYYDLKEDEELYYNDVFNLVPIIFPSPDIFETAIECANFINLI